MKRGFAGDRWRREGLMSDAAEETCGGRLVGLLVVRTYGARELPDLLH